MWNEKRSEKIRGVRGGRGVGMERRVRTRREWGRRKGIEGECEWGKRNKETSKVEERELKLVSEWEQQRKKGGKLDWKRKGTNERDRQRQEGKIEAGQALQCNELSNPVRSHRRERETETERRRRMKRIRWTIKWLGEESLIAADRTLVVGGRKKDGGWGGDYDRRPKWIDNVYVCV